jgi:hypothetical protein
MNRCDSATTFRQRGAGKGLLSSLVALFTLLTVGSAVVSAQTFTHTGPNPPGGPFVPLQICNGQTPQFSMNTTAAGDVTYASAGIAYDLVGQDAGAANGVLIDLLPNLGDDEVYQIPVGQIQQAGGADFIFPFYGKDHNLTAEGLWVGTNGFLRFSDGNPNNNVAVEFGQTGITAQGLPWAGGPNGAIYFLNIDLAPQQGGAEEVWAQVQDGILIVTFDYVSQYNPNLVYPYNQVQVQVKIWSTATGTPGRVEVHLGRFPDPGVVPARNHTIGIEDQCGAVAEAADNPNDVHNDDTWAAADAVNEVGGAFDEDAWEFVPATGLPGSMEYRVRIISPGADGTLETVDPDVLAGTDVAVTAVSTTRPTGISTNPSGLPLNLPITNNANVYYAVFEYENCTYATVGPLTINVNANPTPAITPSTPTTYCDNSTPTFSTTFNVGNTYLWSLPLGGGVINPIGPNNNSAQVVWGAGNNAGTARQIRVIETAPSGCQGTSNLNVTVYRTPGTGVAYLPSGPGLWAAAPACEGTNGVLFTAPAGNATDYQWSLIGFPAGSSIVAGQGTNIITVNIGNDNSNTPSPINAQIQINWRNGGGVCQSTDAITCVIANKPVAQNITGPTVVCQNQTANYSYTPQPGSTQTWTIVGGVVSGVNTNPTVTVIWTALGNPGAGSVSVTETTPSGCTTTHNTLNVSVNPQPTPAIGGPADACTYFDLGSPLNGQALNEYDFITPANANRSYAWSFPTIPGGATTPTFVVGGNVNQVRVRFIDGASAAGSYTLRVIETNTLTGCVDTNDKVINVVRSAQPRTLTGDGHPIDANNANNACVGHTPTYTLSGSPYAAGTAVVASTGSGTVSAVNLATGQFTVTWNAPGRNVIRVTETTPGPNLCVTIRDYEIDVNPDPQGVISGLQDYCADGVATTTYSFIAVPGTTLPSATYTWLLNPPAAGTITAGAGTPSITVRWANACNIGSQVQLTVTNPGTGSCATVITPLTVDVMPKPVIASIVITETGGVAANDNIVCAGDIVTYTIDAGPVPACVTSRQWTWSLINAPAGTPSTGNVTFSNTQQLVLNLQLGSNTQAAGSPNVQLVVSLQQFNSNVGWCDNNTAFTSAAVVVNPLPARPIVTSNPPAPYCFSQPVMPTLTVSNPEANTTYTWDAANLDFGAGLGVPVVGTSVTIVAGSWNVGNNFYQFNVQNTLTGCSKIHVNYNVFVDPDPTPSVVGAPAVANACKNNTIASGLWNPAQTDYKYELAGTPMAGYQYNWTVTNGTIVGYNNNGVNSGGNQTANEFGTTVNTVWNSGAKPYVWVRFLTGNVGTVKVSEIAPGGCQGTSLDYIQNLTPSDAGVVTAGGVVCFSNTSPVTNTFVTLTIDPTVAGTTYRVESSLNPSGPWVNTPAVNVVGTGGSVSVNVPTGPGQQISSPGTWYFRVLADAAACDSYLGNIVSQIVYPNPVQLPVTLVDDVVCEGDTVLVNVGPMVQAFTDYQLARRQLTPSAGAFANVPGMGAMVSTGVFPPATIQLVDASAPAGGIPPTPFTYEYRVIAENALTGCTTWMTQTPDLSVFAPCPIAWVPENIGLKRNRTQACVYNGFEEHLVTYKLDNTVACMSLGSLSWNVVGIAPQVSGAIRQVGPDSIVVEWYSTGGSGMGQVSATLTMPAIYGGCETTITYNTMVFPIPQPVISTGPGEVCAGTQDVDYSATLQTGDNYIWTVIGGTIELGSGAGTVANPSTRSGINLNTIRVDWAGVNPSASIKLRQVSPAGCLNETMRTIKINPNPTPVISGPATVCRNRNYAFSTQNNAPNNIYAWSLSGNTSGANFIGAAAGAAVNVYSGAATGAFTLNVTETTIATGCVGTSSWTVNVVNEPTPVIARISPLPGATGAACLGSAHQYSTGTSGNEYLWTVSGGTITSGANTNTVTVVWNTIGTGMLTVSEWVASSACTTTVSQPVNVVPQPTPAISGAQVACILTPEHTYSTPYVAGHTYLWAITSGTITPCFAPIAGWATSNEITIKWIQPGLHTIQVTETDPIAGCATLIIRQVQVNLSPEPVITTSDVGFGIDREAGVGVVCNNSIHTYSTVATPGNTWVWSVVNGTILPDNGVTGQYRASIRVQWSTASGGSVSVNETVPGSTCTKTVKDSVWIRPTPNPVITGTAPQSNMNAANPCLGSVHTYTTPLVATTTPQVASWNSYRWNVVGGTIISGQGTNTITVQWSTLGGGSVNVIEWVTKSGPYAVQNIPPAVPFSVSDCWATRTFNVTVHPNPNPPVISANINPVCATDLTDNPQTINTVRYTSNTPGPSGYTYTYTWSVSSNGTIVGQASSNPLSNTFIDVQWTNTGNTPAFGYVTLTHTSNWGCATSNQFTATINPIPNPVIVGDLNVCAGEVDNYSTTGVPGNSYIWSLVDANGNTAGGNIIRSGQGTPNVSVEWTLPGTNYLQVRETIIATGCFAINRIAVTVNQLPTAVITPSGVTTFCQGGDVTLSAPIGFAGYQWNTGETSRNIVVNRTGTFWVIVTDANGCTGSSDTIQVNVFPTQLPIITQNGPLTFCEGGSVTLSAPDGFSAYVWSTGETTQSIVVTETGSYTVTVADNQGCTGTSTEVDVTVYEKPDPILSVNGSTTMCDGDSVEVLAPAGYVSYTWYSTVSSTVLGTSRSIVLRSSDTVYCEVVDGNGCVGQSDTVGVELKTIVQPVVTANGPTTFCDGNTVTLTAPEGYATYLWSNGATTREITVDRTGAYTVVVSNSARCEVASVNVNVQVNPLPARPTITRTGDTLKAVSAEAQAYQWYRNGNALAGATEQALVVALPGTYRVEIADNNTCASMSQPFDVVLTDVDEPVAGVSSEVNIFPNPTNGVFTLEADFASAGAVRVELFNLVGDKVLSLNDMSNGGLFRTTVDMGSLATGVYNVVVTAGNERWTLRLVRQ